MYGRQCPECDYSSHDDNGTDYHNECLQKVQAREMKLIFIAGVLAQFVLSLVWRRIVRVA